MGELTEGRRGVQPVGDRSKVSLSLGLDGGLVREVDRRAKARKTSRSALIETAVSRFIERDELHARMVRVARLVVRDADSGLDMPESTELQELARAVLREADGRSWR